MTTQTTDFRDSEKFPYHQYRDFFNYVAGIIIILMVVALGSRLFATDSGYGTNLYTEIISVIITIIFLDYRAERREEKRREIELRERLIRDAGSPIREVAVHTINEIRKLGMLESEDGILKGADLRGADLSGVYLQYANLAGAILWKTNLAGADLVKANLTGANLQIANLAGANLGDANLAGANLFRANLSGAKLSNAKFNEQTLLPDAERTGIDDKGKPIYDKYWTPNTDMTRYTDPNHPDFWQPEWVRGE